MPAASWDVTVLSGWLTLAGRPGDARAFYRGIDVRRPAAQRGAAVYEIARDATTLREAGVVSR